MRHANTLGSENFVLSKMVDHLITNMSAEYNELERAKDLIRETIINEEEKTLSFFIINKSEEESVDLDFDINNLPIINIIDQQIINHTNIYASNTINKPNEIVPKKTNIATFQNENLMAKIPKLSYLFILLKIK